jgi:hypothetical protein
VCWVGAFLLPTVEFQLANMCESSEWDSRAFGQTQRTAIQEIMDALSLFTLAATEFVCSEQTQTCHGRPVWSFPEKDDHGVSKFNQIDVVGCHGSKLPRTSDSRLFSTAYSVHIMILIQVASESQSRGPPTAGGVTSESGSPALRRRAPRRPPVLPGPRPPLKNAAVILDAGDHDRLLTL